MKEFIKDVLMIFGALSIFAMIFIASLIKLGIVEF